MAKILAFKRTDKRVVTVDSITGDMANLGNQIAAAEVTSLFPNRCENIACVFQGDPYLLYLSTTNTIRLARYSGGVWTDVAGFTALVTGTGFLKPVALQVEKDRLVAIACRTGSVGLDGVFARRSFQEDGTTWDAAIFQAFPSQPTNTGPSQTFSWKNAIWFAAGAGLGYYLPDTNVLSATFDTGNDLLLIGEVACFGAFASWKNDLYYVLPRVLPASAPLLYKLAPTWTPALPVAPPAWINTLVALPAVGVVLLTPDSGNYTMFVNKAGALSIFYSGDLGTKLVTLAPAGSSLAVSDLTATQLPLSLSAEPNLGCCLHVDDRRRTNERHTLLIRFRPAIPVSVLVCTWTGTSAVTILRTQDDGGLGLDLMLPDEERGDFRTFTDLQPTCHIRDITQPFPGRVKIDYTVRDSGSRPIDVSGEYSIDGQEWFPMTEGDGDSGNLSLVSTPSGSNYFFFWDAFVDLDGDYPFVHHRLIAKISGV